MTRQTALDAIETARAALVSAAQQYRAALEQVAAAEAAEFDAADDDCEGVDYTTVWAGEYTLLADAAIEMASRPLAR